MKIITGELDPQQGTIMRPNKLGSFDRISMRLTAFASSTRSSWATRRLWDA